MLVPVFRGLRLVRAVRRAKRLRYLFVMLDNLVEGIDIALRLRIRALTIKLMK